MKLDPLPIHPDTVEGARAAARFIATRPPKARDALILSIREYVSSDSVRNLEPKRIEARAIWRRKFPQLPESTLTTAWADAIDMLTDQFVRLVTEFVPRMGDQQLTDTRH